MFFLFFGISPKTIRHGFVVHDCRVHGGSSWHELTTRRSYFTLFFVLRIFPVGGRHELLTCTTCGATWQLPPGEAMRLQAQARTDPGPTTHAPNSASASNAGARGPRSVRAERLDVPRNPQQKVQWRPNG